MKGDVSPFLEIRSPRFKLFPCTESSLIFPSNFKMGKIGAGLSDTPPKQKNGVLRLIFYGFARCAIVKMHIR